MENTKARHFSNGVAFFIMTIMGPGMKGRHINNKHSEFKNPNFQLHAPYSELPCTPQLDTYNSTLKTNTHPAPRNSHLFFVCIKELAEIAHQDYD